MTDRLIIKKVVPGMGKEFAEYFENLDFSHEPHFSSCFCRFYHLDTDLKDWQSRTAKNNRSEAIEEIDSGHMTGYLAFQGDTCIGWLNANPWESLRRLHEYISHKVQGKKVGVIICYVIHPDFRHQGIATRLLEAAIEGFRGEGYEAVMAFPEKVDQFRETLYRGTVSMYDKLGFVEVDAYENIRYMWKTL